MKRIFIALKIPVSKGAEKLLRNVKWVLKDEKIKWIEHRNFHMTLFFIGDTEEDRINDMGRQLVERLKNISSFTLTCQGVGVFRNIFNPKALWIGIKESEDLSKLKGIIDQVMASNGCIIEEKGYQPHLTIGRMKYGKDKDKFKMVVEKYKNVEFQQLTIDAVILYESILTPQGAIYKILKEIRLN